LMCRRVWSTTAVIQRPANTDKRGDKGNGKGDVISRRQKSLVAAEGNELTGKKEGFR